MERDWLTASWSEGWTIGRGNISGSGAWNTGFPPVEEKERAEFPDWLRRAG